MLILIPTYNVEGFVPRLVQNLMRLSYPHHLVDIAFLEGDSEDKSYETIERQLPHFSDPAAAFIQKPVKFYKVLNFRDLRKSTAKVAREIFC